MPERVGLFGGTFDPIHHGHLIVARAIAEQARLDRVIFLPAGAPPHKAHGIVATPADRAQMVRLAIAADPLFDLDEYDLSRKGPSYTIQTIEHFRETLGETATLAWLIGADSLAELASWHRAGDLVASCEILTAGRSGFSVEDWTRLRQALGEQAVTRLRAGIVRTPVIEISSTDIRRRAAAGQSIRYLVPERVAEYIEANHLYA